MYSENWYKFATLMVFMGIAFGCVALFAFQSYEQEIQLEQQNQKLLEKIAFLEAQIGELTASNESLQQQLNAALADLDAHKTENQRLKENIASLNLILERLTALSQPMTFFAGFLERLEQIPWINELMMTGVLVGFPGSCVGFYYLRKPRKHEKTSLYRATPATPEMLSPLAKQTSLPRPSLNGHSKPDNKPLITTSLN